MSESKILEEYLKLLYPGNSVNYEKLKDVIPKSVIDCVYNFGDLNSELWQSWFNNQIFPAIQNKDNTLGAWQWTNKDIVNANTVDFSPIKKGQLIPNKMAWMAWGPYEMLWKSPYDIDTPEVGGLIYGKTSMSRDASKIPGAIQKGTKYVEVTSSLPNPCCDSCGTWYNPVRGSGIFFEIGDFDNILVTRNKLSAILELYGKVKGVTADEEAANEIIKRQTRTDNSNIVDFTIWFWDVSKNDVMIPDKWDASKGPKCKSGCTAVNIGSKIGEPNVTLNQLLRYIAYNSTGTPIVEWLGNVPVLDRYICELAYRLNLNMVQMVCAQYFGFWGNEFVWLEQYIDQTFEEFAKVKLLTVSGPCDKNAVHDETDEFGSGQAVVCDWLGLNLPVSLRMQDVPYTDKITNWLWFVIYFVVILLLIFAIYLITKLIKK